MPEQKIVVVFDVSADTREEAANTVAYAIGMNNPNTPVGYTDSAGSIESWWFPENDIKHVDGNDNEGMVLVDSHLIESLTTAWEQGDAQWMENCVAQITE